ncbi:MAG: CotH kinase family protein, partial [Rhodothermales bacterium]
MLRTLLFAVATIALLQDRAAAQPFQPEYNPVFDDAVIPSIYINIDAVSLDSIMTFVERDVEYTARFVFDDGSIRDTVANVGFRLRGATARHPPKKSFKISFNTFERGAKFYGLEKLNVNSEHNDPSLIRSKLGWDLFAGLAVPATRANHVRLYVNGQYYGLYMNVEHIDEQFLKSRFGNDDGNLYKCLYPADLAYRGPDAAAYRPTRSDRKPYDLTQGASDEEGYADLAHFIDVLNNT